MSTQSQRSRAVRQLLLAVGLLLVLGQLHPVTSAPGVPTRDVVAGPVTHASAAVVRLLRHVPQQPSWAQLDVATFWASGLLLLLLGTWTSAASSSKRARAAHLLTYAGRGPPTRS